MRSQGYFLTITTLNDKLVFASSDKSLRESIRLAGLIVKDMDNYAKVRRNIRAMDGAFAAIYRRADEPMITRGYDVKKLPKHMLVKIHSFDIVWDEVDGPDGPEIINMKPSFSRNISLKSL
jgi:hypothetical protein